MKTKATLQMVVIAKRIAAKNGVSVDEVLERFDRDVEKTSFSGRDLFMGNGVITLCRKKVSLGCRQEELAAASGLETGGGK